MYITLAPTDEELIQVAVDGASSHSFDLTHLIPDEQWREKAFLQEPVLEGAEKPQWQPT